MGAGKLNGRLRQRLEQLHADGSASDPEGSAAADATPAPEPVLTPLPERPDGPFHLPELVSVTGYVDLGALLLPGRRDVSLRVNVSPDGTPSDLAVVHDGWRMDLAVFAAPRTHGTWETVAKQIAASLGADGTTVTVTDGPFGPQLATTTAGPDGARLPLRIWAVDGPGWLLRATLRPVPPPPAPTAAPEETSAPLTDSDVTAQDEQQEDAAEDASDLRVDSWERTVGPAPVDEPDGLPGGVLGEMWRKAIVRRGTEPLPVGASVPMSVDPKMLSGDWAGPVAAPAAPSRFAHLSGLNL